MHAGYRPDHASIHARQRSVRRSATSSNDRQRRARRLIVPVARVSLRTYRITVEPTRPPPSAASIAEAAAAQQHAQQPQFNLTQGVDVLKESAQFARLNLHVDDPESVAKLVDAYRVLAPCIPRESNRRSCVPGGLQMGMAILGECGQPLRGPTPTTGARTASEELLNVRPARRQLGAHWGE